MADESQNRYPITHQGRASHRHRAPRPRRPRGDNHLASWPPGLALTGAERVTRVYVLCLTTEGQLLLVSQDGEFWTLPGGRPKPGETHADTLTREVWEEACARVSEYQYLGAQRVADPGEPEPYYQFRYLARVSLDPFAPAHEMRHRMLVDIDTARRLLWRGESRIAHALLDHASEAIRWGGKPTTTNGESDSSRNRPVKASTCPGAPQ